MLTDQQLLTFFVMTFVVILMTSSVRCDRHWHVDDGGVTRWDYDCDFFGHDITSVPAIGEHQCGHLCLANTRCTHFTFNSNRTGSAGHHLHSGIGKQTCYLKHSNKALNEVTLKPHSGVACGWIAGRSAQHQNNRRH